MKSKLDARGNRIERRIGRGEPGEGHEGRRWAYTYRAFDVLQAIEDPKGGRLSFAYSEAEYFNGLDIGPERFSKPRDRRGSPAFC